MNEQSAWCARVHPLCHRDDDDPHAQWRDAVLLQPMFHGDDVELRHAKASIDRLPSMAIK